MNIIYEGKLITDDQPFQVRQLSLVDLNPIVTLQKAVVELLDRGDTLQPLSKAEFQYILKGNGLMLGVFVVDKLIAFRALLNPPIDDEHLGLDVGLSVKQLSGVIYQEITMVHPKYRGNRLQQLLAGIIMDELEKQDMGYRYICSTVAPHNIPSLKDKFAQGMEIAALKEKYDNKLRYIFAKKIQDDKNGDWSNRIAIPIEDFSRQRKLLAKGWRGFRMVMHGDAIEIEFGKKK